jgi:hypothetical protein
MPEAARSHTTDVEAGGSPAGSLLPNDVLLDHNVIDDLENCIDAISALQFMITPVLERECVKPEIVMGISRLFAGPIDELKEQSRVWRNAISQPRERPAGEIRTRLYGWETTALKNAHQLSTDDLVHVALNEWLRREGWIPSSVLEQRPSGVKAMREDFILSRTAEGVDVATIAQALNIKRSAEERAVRKLRGDPPPGEDAARAAAG